jgi:hypothetical protein
MQRGAAVEQNWGDGPGGGHINRLKTITRQMYDRAGFELVRARVLSLPPPASLHPKEGHSLAETITSWDVTFRGHQAEQVFARSESP